PPIPPLFPYTTLFRSLRCSAVDSRSQIRSIEIANEGHSRHSRALVEVHRHGRAHAQTLRTPRALCTRSSAFRLRQPGPAAIDQLDRKSTRLNSSHVKI